MNAPKQGPKSTRKRNTATVTVVLTALVLLVWWLGVGSAQTAHRARTAEKDGLQAELASMRATVEAKTSVETQNVALVRRQLELSDRLLSPLLGSWAMRAKTMLEDLADACELKNVRYLDVPETVALPALGGPAAKAYVRRRVKIEAEGAYQNLISFLCHVERLHPGALTESVAINGSENPDLQGAVMVFEWLSAPTDGKEARP